MFECKICRLKQLKIEGLIRLRDDLYKEQARQNREINLLKYQLNKRKKNDHQVQNEKVPRVYEKNKAVGN